MQFSLIFILMVFISGITLVIYGFVYEIKRMLKKR